MHTVSSNQLVGSGSSTPLVETLAWVFHILPSKHIQGWSNTKQGKALKAVSFMLPY